MVVHSTFTPLTLSWSHQNRLSVTWSKQHVAEQDLGRYINRVDKHKNLNRRVTTVYNKFTSGHETGFIRSEKQHTLCDIVGLT